MEPLLITTTLLALLLLILLLVFWNTKKKQKKREHLFKLTQTEKRRFQEILQEARRLVEDDRIKLAFEKLDQINHFALQPEIIEVGAKKNQWKRLEEKERKGVTTHEESHRTELIFVINLLATIAHFEEVVIKS